MSAAELFKRYFAPKHLAEVFHQSIYGSTAVGVDRVTTENFNSHLDENVNDISQRVLQGKYHFAPYKQVLLSKGAGRCPRVLSIPTVRDRLVLKVLSNIIDELFGLDCKTPNPQSLITEMERDALNGKFDCFIKIDFSDFYGSINHELLMKTLRSKIRKREILTLIESAVINQTVPIGVKRSSSCIQSKGVPQGLSVSGSLANLVASKIDRRMIKAFPSIFYRRYVDDILIVCSVAEYGKAERKITALARGLHLCLNKEKVLRGHLNTDCFEYLGYRFSPSLISVRSSSKRSIERSLEQGIKKIARAEKNHGNPSSANDAIRCRGDLYRTITGCRVTYDGVSFARYGWLFYYSRINDVSYLAQLDALVRKMAKRYGVGLAADTPSFKKAYYQMRYNGKESSYFPTFNFDATVEEMRHKLAELLGDGAIASLSDEKIALLYRKAIHRITKSLERDVGLIS